MNRLISIFKAWMPKRKEVYVFNILPVNKFMPYLWLGKVGNSVNSNTRAEDVARSILEKVGIEVEVKVFTSARVFAWRLIEKTTHGLLKFYQTDAFRGASGWTEIFRVVNVICAGIVLLITCYFLPLKTAYLIAGIVAALPWPLDMAAIVWFFVLVEWVIITAITFIFFWFIYCFAIAFAAV